MFCSIEILGMVFLVWGFHPSFGFLVGYFFLIKLSRAPSLFPKQKTNKNSFQYQGGFTTLTIWEIYKKMAGVEQASPNGYGKDWTGAQQLNPVESLSLERPHFQRESIQLGLLNSWIVYNTKESTQQLASPSSSRCSTSRILGFKSLWLKTITIRKWKNCCLSKCGHASIFMFWILFPYQTPTKWLSFPNMR